MVIINGQQQKVASCMLVDILRAFSIEEATVKVDGMEIPMNSKFKITDEHEVVITTPEFATVGSTDNDEKPAGVDAAMKMVKKQKEPEPVPSEQSPPSAIPTNLLDVLKKVEPNEAGNVAVAIYDDGSAAILDPKGRGPKMVRLINLNVKTGESEIVNAQGSQG
jgi:hypothetical protein